MSDWIAARSRAWDAQVWESASHDWGIAIENRSPHAHAIALRTASRDLKNAMDLETIRRRMAAGGVTSL